MKFCILFKFSFFFLALFLNAQNTIKTRFLLPKSYTRVLEKADSFGDYLRNLPLKSKESVVSYFNGKTKKQTVYDAVLDLPIGNKDLHQCADAVMRLRADYFFNLREFNEIHFNFTNGFRVDYSKWRLGNRIFLKGNTAFWKKTCKPSDNYESYWQYLETIFQYAGTASLEKELIQIDKKELQIGDVFIKGGFPGHAVIVVDMAVDSNQKKIFLLAQSYMPAQELQILKNPKNLKLSPWYELDFKEVLITPEWVFNSYEVKRFQK